MRESWLPFHHPSIDEAELQAVMGVLRSGWLTTGPRTKEFEAEFGQFVGAPYAVAVNSGTAALHLALDAVGVREGDEVLVPTLTFAATAEVVLYLKARPVLVDCGADLNIDAKGAERAMSPRTKAIIPVHYGGLPCAMEPILSMAKSRGLAVIEDAAHALPAAWKGKRVGSIGDITCFSFYATKTLSTGEGGMATTDNAEYADRMRIMSLHGISKDAWKRYTAQGSWYYEILRPGYKYNMTDIAAALGLAQLEKCRWMADRRTRIAETYDAAFGKMPEIQLPPRHPDAAHAWHLYVVRLHLDRLRIDRNAFIDELKSRNIGTSVHFIPLHLHPLYRDAYGYKRGDFPSAEAAFDRMISLPIYPRMSDQDVQDVIDAVADVIEKNRR